MKQYLYKIFKRMLLIWFLWAGLLTGYELIKQEIPNTLHLYEEEALEVLSGTEKKIDPEELYLDFSGDVEITQTENGCYEAVCNLFGVIPIKTMEVEVVQEQELESLVRSGRLSMHIQRMLHVVVFIQLLLSSISLFVSVSRLHQVLT